MAVRLSADPRPARGRVRLRVQQASLDDPISFSARRCPCRVVSPTAARMSTSLTVSACAAGSARPVSLRVSSRALRAGPPQLAKGGCGPLEQSWRLALEAGWGDPRRLRWVDLSLAASHPRWAPTVGHSRGNRAVGLFCWGRCLQEDGGQRGGARPGPITPSCPPAGVTEEGGA